MMMGKEINSLMRIRYRLLRMQTSLKDYI